MEQFDFGLRLVENVSQPGKRAADALMKVEAQAKKTNEALSGKQMAGLGKQFERVGFAAARDQQRRADSFAKMWEKVGLAAAKAQQRAAAAQDRALTSRVKARERAIQQRVDKLQEHSLLGGVKEGLGVGKLMQASFWGSLLAEGVFHIIDGMVEGAKKAVEVIVEGVKFAFESAGKRQSITLGERLSLGAGAKDYQQDIKRFSKLTGMHPSEIEEMLLPLRRSGMNQQDTRTAFAAASDVAAGKGKGGDRGEIEKYLKAFESLRLRGNIEVEQLAGLGIDVHKFYKTIAKKTGTDEQTARTNMTNGKVDRKVLLNTLYEGIEKEQGGKLGTGAIAYSKTSEARWAKLKQLPEQMLMSIASTAAFQRASDAIGSLLEKLDPDGPAGQRIIKSLEDMFDKVAGFVGSPDEAAESMADHIEDALDTLKQVVEVGRELADAFLPSLETIEDMILAFREMKAMATGNTAAQMQVTLDRAAVNQKRIDRSTERDVKAATPEIYASKLASNMLSEQFDATIAGFGGPIGLNPLAFGASMMNAEHDTQVAQNDLRRAGGSTRQVAVTAPKIELNFYGPVDEDTARQVGPEIHRETANALEQAAAGSF